MNNKEFSKHLEIKTKKFAIGIIRLSAKLPNTTEGKVSETLYWIEIVQELDWISIDEINLIQIESSEILALFTSISNKLNINKTLNTL